MIEQFLLMLIKGMLQKGEEEGRGLRGVVIRLRKPCLFALQLKILKLSSLGERRGEEESQDIKINTVFINNNYY
jgi:hypothetical protein